MIFSKGDTVRITTAVSGRGPQLLLKRATSPAERTHWYTTSAAQGMDSAGESKLAPRSTFREAHSGERFTVVRGRARYHGGWGNPQSGYVLMEDTDGVRWYAKKASVKIVLG
jgi:hypothetical protein